MNFTESQYCKFPRLVCISVGLWPYTYKRHRFRSFCVYVFLLSGIICQLVPLTRCERTAETFSALGILLISIAMVSKFHGYYFNLDKIRRVFDYIEDDWKMFTNEGELETIMKYANRGKLLNLYMIGIFSTLVALFIAYPFVVMAWSHQALSLQIPIYIDYFMEHDRYVLWILLYIDVQTIVGTSTLLAAGSATVIFMFHLCGVFRIVSDRMQKTVASSILNARNGNKYSPSVRKQLVAALELHQRLLELIEYLNKSFSKYYFYLIYVGVAAMSVNLYVIAISLSLKKITQKLLISITLVCCSIFQMYYDNYLGQKIIDAGNELFMSTYSTRWYESPLPMQKTLLFVRLRCMKRSSYISTIFFVASMECLFVLTNACVSYFMMIYTLMQRL